jgi:hypothetical protein
MNDMAERDCGLEFGDGIPVERYLALESLWRALRDRDNMRIGYNPAVTEACEELRRLDRNAGGEDEPHKTQS